MLDDFWKDLEEGWAWGGLSVRRSRGTYYPPVNIYETDDKYIVLMELPGINPDLIKLEYESGHLKIRGKELILYVTKIPNIMLWRSVLESLKELLNLAGT